MEIVEYVASVVSGEIHGDCGVRSQCSEWGKAMVIVEYVARVVSGEKPW